MLLPIGDTLFTTPAIHALRARYPRARITALVYPTNAGILRNNPGIDELLEWPTTWTWSGFRRLLSVVRRLHRAHFDLAVEFSNYNWYLTRFLRVPRRSDMQLPPLWWVRPGAGKQWRRSHAVEHYANPVRRLGINIEDWHLRIIPTPEEKARAEGWLARHRVGPQEMLVALHPGGEGLWGLKRWDVARFAAVADGLSEKFGARIVIMGGKDDAAYAAELASLTSAYIINAAGQTTLGETAALASLCTLFIGNDSSPLHLAAAIGTRVIGVYGPTDPRSYRPWVPGGKEGVDYAVVRSPAPCAHRFPLVGGITFLGWASVVPCRALEAITPADVLNAANKILRSPE